MKLNYDQYKQILDCFPRQRENVRLDNLSVLNAILYVVENGCKWRSLPSDFGHCHTIYARWAKSGVFAKLQQQQILSVTFDVHCLDNTSVKIRPNGTSALKNLGRNLSTSHAEVATLKFIWLPRTTELR